MLLPLQLLHLLHDIQQVADHLDIEQRLGPSVARAVAELRVGDMVTCTGPPDTIAEAARAGANVFVAGTAVFGASDPLSSPSSS